MKTIEIEGIEFGSAHDAIQHTNAADGEPIHIGDQYLVVTKSERERIETAGFEFAMLFDHNGLIITVPVNDG